MQVNLEFGKFIKECREKRTINFKLQEVVQIVERRLVYRDNGSVLRRNPCGIPQQISTKKSVRKNPRGEIRADSAEQSVEIRAELAKICYIQEITITKGLKGDFSD